MEINYNNKTPYTRGLLNLDKRFGKPEVRELIILYGYMSCGKTEFAYFVARNNIEKSKILFVSLEYPEYEMKLRIARKSAGINKYDFQIGNYDEVQKNAMDKKFEEIDNMENIRISNYQDKSLNNIIIQMKMAFDEGYRMFIIDNLDKIWSEGKEDENSRYQRITSTLQDLKNSCDMCIILLHHAKKPDSKNPYKRAGLSGMRGSQKIMDNSTQVFEIYRDLDPEIEDKDRPRVEFIQMKDSADGANGFENIYFNKGKYQETNPFLPF